MLVTKFLFFYGSDNQTIFCIQVSPAVINLNIILYTVNLQTSRLSNLTRDNLTNLRAVDHIL